MSFRRVVVTGLGQISALGHDVPAFWTALSGGSTGIRPIQGFDLEGIRFANGAQVQSYDPSAHFAARSLDLFDRFTQFALLAARQAVADAGLGESADWRERGGVVTGTAAGGMTAQDALFHGLYGLKRPRIHPFSIPQIMSNAGASQISIEFGITGPAYTVSTACASATHAIGLALLHVRAGLVDVAVAGGSESPFTPAFLRSWDALRVVSGKTCRPFSADRDGMILGEGAGMLVLESLEHATARGAHVYAEIAGFGMSADAHHITQPSASGPARAMRSAIEDGGIAPEEVGYINAHGTGTTANDATECLAIRQVFGAQAERLAVSSTKSMHGHALGAAGALEAVATVLALAEEVLPPTVNFTSADPACDLNVIPNTAQRKAVGAALSNSFAFGGLNAALAFRRHGVS